MKRCDSNIYAGGCGYEGRAAYLLIRILVLSSRDKGHSWSHNNVIHHTTKTNAQLLENCRNFCNFQFVKKETSKFKWYYEYCLRLQNLNWNWSGQTKLLDQQYLTVTLVSRLQMYFERTLKSCFMDQCGVLLLPHSSGWYSILTSGALKMLKALKTVFLRLQLFFLNKSTRETGGTLEVTEQTVWYSLEKKCNHQLDIHRRKKGWNNHRILYKQNQSL